MSEKHIGKVIQVIGPVLDIQFKDGELPELLNAIEIDNHGQKLVVEVAQLTGDNVARCIAMSSTDGLVRGTDAVDTGESIKVPVGDQCLGRSSWDATCRSGVIRSRTSAWYLSLSLWICSSISSLEFTSSRYAARMVQSGKIRSGCIQRSMVNRESAPMMKNI